MSTDIAQSDELQPSASSMAQVAFHYAFEISISRYRTFSLTDTPNLRFIQTLNIHKCYFPHFCNPILKGANVHKTR